MQLKKFLAIFDAHIGHEKGLEGGRWISRPTFNKKAIKAVVNFAKDFAPDVFILGGDQLNCGPVSHWHHGKPLLDEGFRLKQEMDTLEELILDPFKKVERKIWHDGNHEQWIYDNVATNPGIEGLIEPKHYLDLERKGYELYSQGEISKLGKLNFCHGDVVLGKGSYQNPAKTLVLAYRRNIRGGHVHTYSSAIESTAVDAKDYHSGIVVPSLSTKNPFWVKNRPNQFMQGFLFGYSWEDGSFNDTVVIINKDEFTVGGKRYKA